MKRFLHSDVSELEKETKKHEEYYRAHKQKMKDYALQRYHQTKNLKGGFFTRGVVRDKVDVLKSFLRNYREER